MFKKIVLLSVSVFCLASAEDMNMRDMGFSVSDKKFTVSGSNLDTLKGFDVKLGRFSDFGKIYLRYGDVSSTDFEFRDYSIGVDAYFLKNPLLDLSIGISLGDGKLKDKINQKEREIFSGNLGVQADIHFNDKFDIFGRIGYLKNWELNDCSDERDKNLCIDSKQLKDLDYFNSRTLEVGFTYRF